MILDKKRSIGSISDHDDGPSESKERPPPYNSGYQPPPRRLVDSSMKRPSVSSPSPAPTVSQIHLDTGSNPISGIFYIDPRVPNMGFNAKGFKAYKKNAPHASFRTRQGAISLELGTTGEATRLTPKANVLVASRSGDIDIKLPPTVQTRPRLGLQVLSRHGDVVLFIPRNYSGAIQLRTRKGSIRFLPALASAMKVMKQDDNEALVLFGEQTLSREVDFCEITSRFGKLTVGFSDLDKYEAKVGFWRRIGMLLGGN